MTDPTTRKITVNALTRVEGEGALRVRLCGERIESVQLSIYEPPRFFESLLRGRTIEEVPDITARICGICPVAYQMTSVHALEQALKVQITPEIRTLRRLLYCGEWIESHVLHIYMLNAPDFIDSDSGIDLARRFPAEVNRGLRLKKIGNRLLEILGGRAIHPINVRVGGFYRSPDRAQLTDLLADLHWGLNAAVDSARWVSEFHFPVFDRPCELISLRHDDEYPMNEGVIASTHRDDVFVSEYESKFFENQVSHSTALQAEVGETREPYLLGPLSRLKHNRGQLFPQAQKLASELLPEQSQINRFSAIIARSIEVVHAFEEAISIIQAYQQLSEPFVPYSYCHGQGCAATEAPRGMIFHSYEINDSGLVVNSKIVPPTSQNQKQIELDLKGYLPSLLKSPDEVVAMECEKLIRTFDPCISCSTHFLRLEVERT